MSNSQKISQFNNKTLFNDSDLLTIVRGGQNYNVTFADLKNSLGVTGTLSQDGDELGVPVLIEPTAGDYRVRNIESEKGVIASTSPDNGVSVGCNFSQPVVGAGIIKDLNADEYLFKTLSGGAGVTLSEQDETIKIDFTAETVATKTVLIASIDDFPEAVDGVITLNNDTDYLLTEDIVTSNRFVVGAPNTIRAAASQMVSFTYTGTDTMFTAVDPNLKFIDITVSAPNGHLLNSTSPSKGGIVQMVESNVGECRTLGTIEDNFITRFTNIAFERLIDGGITFSGENQALVISTGIAFIEGGSVIDFGTSTFKAITISGGIVQDSAVGTFFFSGLPDSGNIAPGGRASVAFNKGFGGGESLSGISQKDSRWDFFGNNAIPNSINDGLISVEGSATQTVISSVGVAVKINNVWDTGETSRFIADASGRLTYSGEVPSTLPIDLTSTTLVASGGDKQVSMSIAINGVSVGATRKISTVSSAKAASITTLWQHTFAPGDYVEGFVANETDTTNIVVEQAILRIN